MSACRHYFINHSQLIQAMSHVGMQTLFNLIILAVMLCNSSACRHYLIEVSHFWIQAIFLVILPNMPIAGGNTEYLMEVQQL